MRPFSGEFAVRAVGGSLRGPMPGQIASVCTDTRAIRPGCLFVALRGERFDGHDFVAAAFAKGAAAALCETPPAGGSEGPVILVPSTGKALLDLAAAYRALFPVRVTAVTGSVGKTSTKEMVWAVLSQKYNTLKNEGNRNNQIGMPMSVFDLEDAHQAAVFEMGMSGFGEISSLARLAKPQAALITNIGVSHIEKLGSRENILKAKLEILEGLQPGGTLVLNFDDPMLREAAGKLSVPVLSCSVSDPGCDFFAKEISGQDGGISFLLCAGKKEIPVELPVPGLHNVHNALMACAAGSLFGVSCEEAARGLACYAPAGMRQKLVRKGGYTFIEDCYNASPDSMSAAFEVLRGLAVSGRRVAVLGDMLELGDHAKDAHGQVGELAAQKGVDLLLACGDQAKHYCSGFVRGGGDGRRCLYFSSRDDLSRRLPELIAEGDAVLFKASHAMRFEELIAGLYRHLEP